MVPPWKIGKVIEGPMLKLRLLPVNQFEKSVDWRPPWPVIETVGKK